MALKALVLVLALSLCFTEAQTAQEDTEEMDYEELVEFADGIWIDVESGSLAPSDAMDLFEETTGETIFEFMTEPGEPVVSVDEGVLDGAWEEFFVPDSGAFVQKKLFKYT